MSLTHITNTIEQKTQEEIDKVLKQAKKEASQILKSAEKKAGNIKIQITENLEKRTQEKITKAKRNAQTQVKNQVSAKKREILEQVFNKALQKLETQQNLLKKIYQKLAKNLPQDKKAEIIISPNLKPLLKKNMALSVKTELKQTGFKFVGAKIEIDNSLSRLIEGIREGAEIEAAKVLFE